MGILYYKLWKVTKRLSSLVLRVLDIMDNYLYTRLENNKELAKEVNEKNMIETTQTHNMATHSDEIYYERQYWYWIKIYLENYIKEIPDFNDNIMLDLGCGQGRLTIPLSKWCLKNGCENIVGVDISENALNFARQFATRESVGEVIEFFEMDILDFLKDQKDATFSVVICTEVFLFYPQYKKVLNEIERVLIPGGLLIASFRSRYFNVLYSLDQKKISSLSMLLNQNEGFPWGPPTKFIWHSVSEARKVILDAGFYFLSYKGIGVCSGIEGDPLARIIRPSMLTNEEQDELMTIELAMAEEMANSGRYILITARKKTEVDSKAL